MEEGQARGEGRGEKGKNSFPPLPLSYFHASTSPLESIFDSPQLLVSRKSISIAQQNTPALRANTAPLGVHWFVDCSFVLNGQLRSLVTYRTLYALYLPLGVCVYFWVNSTFNCLSPQDVASLTAQRKQFLSIANLPTSVRGHQGHPTTVFCKYLFGEADIA